MPSSMKPVGFGVKDCTFIIIQCYYHLLLLLFFFMQTLPPKKNVQLSWSCMELKGGGQEWDLYFFAPSDVEWWVVYYYLSINSWQEGEASKPHYNSTSFYYASHVCREKFMTVTLSSASRH